MVAVNFSVNGKLICYQLCKVLYIPEAPNNLLLISWINNGGGYVKFKKGECTIYFKDNNIIGVGKKTSRLYLLDVRAELPGQEKSNLAAPLKLTWDQWHQCYGHIAYSTLKTLKKTGMVSGFVIDESSIPSQLCKACIQAKQAYQPFSKEAEN